MRLKTKLVLAATTVTFAIVLVLSFLFLCELMRQRIAQTAASNDVMARQVLMMTRQAIEVGLRAHPPAQNTDEALHKAVTEALQSHEPLNDTMKAFVRYSSSVQDVSVTDAHGWTLVSTDPLMWNQQSATRMSFDRVRDASVSYQLRQVFGSARVLDVELPLDRNRMPFLIIHVGLRSTFLKNNYVPFIKTALLLVLLCGVISMAAAGLLANLALRPIEEISQHLERLSGPQARGAEAAGPHPGRELTDGGTDAVVRVTNTIDRIGQQMRTTEAGYTDLQANLNQMLDTLRDGVVLFTSERRAVMVSDAVANFVELGGRPLVGRLLSEIFMVESALGAAVLRAFEHQGNVSAERVRLDDGREVEISIDRIEDGRGRGVSSLGTLLTLRDSGSAMKLEQELEVSRRLAAVGRLTAGVGHEVKNPINAMVVHLELLRSKLSSAGEGRSFLSGAQRHVDILAGEMERLDRVVQTLADFTRPMELNLQEVDLAEVIGAVVELTDVEMMANHVRVVCKLEPVRVRADSEMLRQAMLNLLLNGMQAMPAGGNLRVTVRREKDAALLEVADDGEGIPPALMPRIFDLYFTTKPKGSGIGLAMTYRIVQMHGGAMDVLSEVGRGATFTMKLPAASAASAAEGRVHARLAAGRIA